MGTLRNGTGQEWWFEDELPYLERMNRTLQEQPNPGDTFFNKAGFLVPRSELKPEDPLYSELKHPQQSSAPTAGSATGGRSTSSGTSSGSTGGRTVGVDTERRSSSGGSTSLLTLQPSKITRPSLFGS